jgi:hypothetical protein
MRQKQIRWISAAAKRIIQLAEDADTLEDAVRVIALRFLRGIAYPPTDLTELGKRLNVKKIEPVAGLPISGELRPDGDGFKVVYSASMSQGRQRFTIAHEFGHAVFETTGPNCPRCGRELERICDMLASEFLMPRDVFIGRIRERIDPAEILHLAREFETSVAAAAVRCRQLFGVSTFQLKGRDLEWGVGLIRGERDFKSYSDALRSSIDAAMDGANGEEVIYLRSGLQKLQWTCLKGQSRVLFVLQPGNYASVPRLGSRVPKNS